MRSHVTFQIFLPQEPLAAHVAVEIPLPVMFDHVHFQTLRVEKFLMTHRTLDVLFFQMSAPYVIHHKGVSSKKFMAVSAFMSGGMDVNFVPLHLVH